MTFLNKNADSMNDNEVVHIARLANLRMWNAYKALDAKEAV